MRSDYRRTPIRRSIVQLCPSLFPLDQWTPIVVITDELQPSDAATRHEKGLSHDKVGNAGPLAGLGTAIEPDHRYQWRCTCTPERRPPRFRGHDWCGHVLGNADADPADDLLSRLCNIHYVQAAPIEPTPSLSPVIMRPRASVRVGWVSWHRVRLRQGNDTTWPEAHTGAACAKGSHAGRSTAGGLAPRLGERVGSRRMH